MYDPYDGYGGDSRRSRNPAEEEIHYLRGEVGYLRKKLDEARAEIDAVSGLRNKFTAEWLIKYTQAREIMGKERGG